MESAYRMWIKERKEGLRTGDSVELCRELQTALGTAKWQLEEFERAIRLSHGHCSDDITATRHKQFISAIESQISHVEAALKEAFIEEGKQPLRWVNLDEEECDDLAIFLSGTSPSLLQPSTKNTLSENCQKRKDTDSNNATCNGDTSEVQMTKVFKDSGKDAECIIDVEDGESSGRSNDVSCGLERTTGTRKTWCSPNLGTLNIVIADKYNDRTKTRSGIESTPKEKGSKPFFRKQRCGDLPQAKGAFNLFYQYTNCNMSQRFGWISGLLRHLQSPVHLQFSCSLQLTLALLIAIFLIGFGFPLEAYIASFNLFPSHFQDLGETSSRAKLEQERLVAIFIATL
ncbi:hypothetical protein Goklo_013218 [Gossypium klotzschianum]|uniref:Syntaxin 6/10/61 N-terminal domain-containing protein n=1 Tax=Gossypium klotzschianum TaxID=34286 RepID=A0A7J8U3W4_9ROSI|nr:hypothetical protein [Gossypium klotzschianum]